MTSTFYLLFYKQYNKENSYGRFHSQAMQTEQATQCEKLCLKMLLLVLFFFGKPKAMVYPHC